jgi:hypothetical protein
MKKKIGEPLSRRGTMSGWSASDWNWSIFETMALGRTVFAAFKVSASYPAEPVSSGCFVGVGQRLAAYPRVK